MTTLLIIYLSILFIYFLGFTILPIIRKKGEDRFEFLRSYKKGQFTIIFIFILIFIEFCNFFAMAVINSEVISALLKCDAVDLLSLDGSGIVAYREDHRVSLDLKCLALLVGNDYRAITDLFYTRFKMYGNLVGLEAVAEVGGVCKTDSGGDDEVVHHLDDHGLFALKEGSVLHFSVMKSFIFCLFVR